MDAGPLTPGDLSGPELPAEGVLDPTNETETYGGVRAPLGGTGGLLTGEC